MQVTLPILNRAAHLCLLSYHDDPQEGTLATWENAAALMIEDREGDRLWVAVRGTDDLRDLFDDVSCVRHDYTGFNVHYGFFDYAVKVWSGLVQHKTYRDAVNRNKEIIIVGHSLGGAAAIMLPIVDLDLGHHGNVQHIITFGSPRVFNGGTNPIHHPFYGKILRIVRPMDIVPDVPLRGNMRCPLGLPISHWSHVGNEMYLSPGRLVQEGPSRIWNWVVRSGRYLAHLPVYASRLLLHKTLGTPQPHSLLLHDHSMSTYATEISSL